MKPKRRLLLTPQCAVFRYRNFKGGSRKILKIKLFKDTDRKRNHHKDVAEKWRQEQKGKEQRTDKILSEEITRSIELKLQNSKLLEKKLKLESDANVSSEKHYYETRCPF